MSSLIYLLVVLPSVTRSAEEPKTFMGPINVERFNQLKEHLKVEPKALPASYVAIPVFNIFMNVLVESVLQSEGSRFCLPASWLTLPIGQIFFMLVPEVDVATRQASPQDDLRETVVKYLQSKLPCKKA